MHGQRGRCGAYSVEAELDGGAPGSAVLLWPGDDRWPGQEIDLAQTAVDGSGRHHGTVQWDNNGSDAYDHFIHDSVHGGAFHDCAVRLGPGRITLFVDGVQKATTASRVRTDHDAGGMNNVIGSLDNSAGAPLTVREAEHNPF